MKSWSRVLLVSLLLCLVSILAIAAFSQASPVYKLSYRLSISKPESHLFQVTINVGLPSGLSQVDLQMPRWSPGRYAIFDFAKNVQDFEASVSCAAALPCPGAPLVSNRIDDQTWRVFTAGATELDVSYKVFADDLSGTFSQLNPRHANFNGGSVFMYLVDHKQDPVTLDIDAPASWRIVNGRMQTNNQRRWQFPNYDLLIDTPTEIGPNWTEDDFQSGGKLYHVVVHSFGDEGGKRGALVAGLAKITRAETAMWGPPDFDSFTFIIHFAEDRSSDGMEHLTSTQIIQPGTLSEPGMYEKTLDTASHEFFHVWNMKRLRPVELGPWDFTRPVATTSLWIGEGVTNYYGHLLQRRAGIWNDAKLFTVLGDCISGVQNSPGNRVMSVEEASIIAPLIDGAPRAQHTNLTDTSISYYSKGEVTALALDFLIRGETGGRASLDDLMRLMYQRFYLDSPNATYYLRGRGYTGEDFEHAASEVAGQDLSDFFRRYVRGVESPPYSELLAPIGLQIIREVAREPYTAGITISYDDLQSTKVAAVQPGSPAERAGLQPDDVIVSIGKAYVTTESWRGALNLFKRLDRVPLTVRRERRTFQTMMVLGPPELYSYRIVEMQNAPLKAKALREDWLNGER